MVPNGDGLTHTKGASVAYAAVVAHLKNGVQRIACCESEVHFAVDENMVANDDPALSLDPRDVDVGMQALAVTVAIRLEQRLRDKNPAKKIVSGPDRLKDDA